MTIISRFYGNNKEAHIVQSGSFYTVQKFVAGRLVEQNVDIPLAAAEIIAEDYVEDSSSAQFLSE